MTAIVVIQVFSLFGPSQFQVERLGGRDFILRIPGKIERRFRGELQLSGGRAYVAMDLETAVASTVAAESLPGASFEALKAQAVVARSYFTAGRGRHRGFDFCDTTHCQFLRELKPESSVFARAAAETRGLVLSYEGAVIAALYSASCGGRTQSLADVGMASSGYPYFAVSCEGCLRRPLEWSSKLYLDDGVALLAHPHSEAVRLELGRRLGWGRVPGNNYQAHQQGDTVVLRGRGAGHGVGLCQTGAAGGTDFREILDHYFPATALVEQTTQWQSRSYR